MGVVVVHGFCSGSSQAKALGWLVAAVLFSTRAILACIGRGKVRDAGATHAIERSGVSLPTTGSGR